MDELKTEKLAKQDSDTMAVEGLLTLEEASRLLACTPAAVRKWITQGRVQKVRLGRLVRVRRGDIVAITKNGLPPRRSATGVRMDKTQKAHSAHGDQCDQLEGGS